MGLAFHPSEQPLTSPHPSDAHPGSPACRYTGACPVLQFFYPLWNACCVRLDTPNAATPPKTQPSLFIHALGSVRAAVRRRGTAGSGAASHQRSRGVAGILAHEADSISLGVCGSQGLCGVSRVHCAVQWANPHGARGHAGDGILCLAVCQQAALYRRGLSVQHPAPPPTMCPPLQQAAAVRQSIALRMVSRHCNIPFCGPSDRPALASPIYFGSRAIRRCMRRAQRISLRCTISISLPRAR